MDLKYTLWDWVVMSVLWHKVKSSFLWVDRVSQTSPGSRSAMDLSLRQPWQLHVTELIPSDVDLIHWDESLITAFSLVKKTMCIPAALHKC